MIDFILLLIIGSLWIWGVHCLFSDGYLLEKIGSFFRGGEYDPLARKWLDVNWFYKPLIGCPPCMSSVHGILIGAFFYGISFQVIPFVICLCGINFILKNIIYPEYE